MLKKHIGNISVKAKNIILSVVYSLLLLFCVYPSFSNIGKLFLQILTTVVLSCIVALTALKIKNGLKILALALNIFIIGLLVFVFVCQVFLQLQNHIEGNVFSGWIYFFYYDKSMTVGLVWVSIFIMVTIFRITSGRFRTEKASKEYIGFFNISSRGFILYYILLLTYSFVVIRGFGSHPSAPNFIPFQMIKEYIRVHDYEVFMVFFGNLLLFTPFGFYTAVIKQKKHVIFLLLIPVMISTVIELSQLVFKNGNCDIDDVILNSIGFYLGVFMKRGADLAIKRRTCGSELTVFNWLPYSLFNLSEKNIRNL